MKISRIVIAGASLYAATTALACEIPSMIMIPTDKSELQGNEQRLRDDAQAYIDGMNAYVQCIRAELTAAGGDEAPPMIKSLLVRRNNEAAAESEAVVNWLKEALGGAADPGAAGAGDANAEQDHERRSRRRDKD
jgi:hypothetical protein